jgi:hypothetical protein
MTSTPYSDSDPDSDIVPSSTAKTTLVPVVPEITLEIIDPAHALVGLNRGQPLNKSLWLLFQNLPPLQQLTVGSLLGMALTLAMTNWGLPKTTVPLTALLSSGGQTSKTALLSLELMRRGFRETLAIPLQPLPPRPVPFTPKSLQPVMMDRFYLPGQVALDGQPQANEGTLMVDRFYFTYPLPHHTATGPIAPEVYAVQEILTVPSLPPDAHYYQALGSLPAAPLPQPPAQPTTQPSPQRLNSRSSLLAQPHTLVGVVKTNQFSAALFKTGDTSYAVRLGENLGQGQLQLIEVSDRAATLSDGQNHLVLNVGETF